MLTFTCRKTSNISVVLTEIFFFGEHVGIGGEGGEYTSLHLFPLC